MFKANTGHVRQECMQCNSVSVIQFNHVNKQNEEGISLYKYMVYPFNKTSVKTYLESVFPHKHNQINTWWSIRSKQRLQNRNHQLV